MFDRFEKVGMGMLLILTLQGFWTKGFLWDKRDSGVNVGGLIWDESFFNLT